MSIANYAENQILDAILNADVGDLPIAAVYVKLHLGDPGEDCTANPAANTTREAVTFGAAASGVSTSDADVTWTSVPNAETYSHISLWDAATAGNPLWSGALSASEAVTVGNTFTIPSGDLTVSLD
jgi:hypothetical protein